MTTHLHDKPVCSWNPSFFLFDFDSPPPIRSIFQKHSVVSLLETENAVAFLCWTIVAHCSDVLWWTLLGGETTRGTMQLNILRQLWRWRRWHHWQFGFPHVCGQIIPHLSRSLRSSRLSAVVRDQLLYFLTPQKKRKLPMLGGSSSPSLTGVAFASVSCLTRIACSRDIPCLEFGRWRAMLS